MLPEGQAPANWGQPTPVPGWQPQQQPQAAPQGQGAQAAPQQPPQPSRPPQTAQAPANGTQLAMLPSQLVLNRQLASTRFVDERGRLIGIVKPNPAFRMRMLRMAGSELVQNAPYMGLFMLAASVREIDGEQLPEPTSPLQVEHLVQRLDQEGLDAIGEAMQRVWGIGLQPEELKAAQEQALAAKNL
jgi:hypothetical protein